VGELRADVIPLATGRVLEVGFGSGHNLPWYDPERVERVIGLEPAEAMWARARERIARAPFPVEPLALEGEEIPLASGSVDSVVVTFTLCTIPDPHRALAGMRRVLRPGGSLLFCEHGRAPEPGLARWQRRIEPLWRRVFGGCHLARDVPALLREGGFTVERLESGFVEGAPRIAGWGCRGVARPA
jgi:ubiquinone/menaquinone biosynthesis C-methylase UbiE